MIGLQWILFILIFPDSGHTGEISDNIVCLQDVAPEVQQDMRYAGRHNFTGRPVPGYESADCLLSGSAAKALKAVQQDLAAEGLGLKVYDCYRPQMAVDAFMNWAGSGDAGTRPRYFPRLSKQQLLDEVYIARRSGHTRGSTVDVTLVDPGQEPTGETAGFDACSNDPARRDDGSLDMGTGFDCFDMRSNTDHPNISEAVQSNRFRLRAVMHRHGFRNYPREWWHYTLEDEPYPERYFSFPITSEICHLRQQSGAAFDWTGSTGRRGGIVRLFPDGEGYPPLLG